MYALTMSLTELNDDPILRARVADAVHTSVAGSFAATGGTPTQGEIKRRTNICLEQFKIMRHDLGWGVAKICDLMPESLRAELDAGDPATFFSEMDRRGWVKLERQTAGGLILP